MLGNLLVSIFLLALLSGDTLNRGNIEIKPNVKFKEVIKKVATDSNVIKDATCDFTDTATVTLTERVLHLKSSK